MNKKYQLSDSVIMQIAKCVQLSILTQTDVSEQLRKMTLEEMEDTGLLKLSQEYIVESETYIQNLVENARKLQEDKQKKNN